MTEMTVEEGVGDDQLCVSIIKPSDELPFPPNFGFTLTANTQPGSSRTCVDCYS